MKNTNNIRMLRVAVFTIIAVVGSFAFMSYGCGVGVEPVTPVTTITGTSIGGITALTETGQVTVAWTDIGGLRYNVVRIGPFDSGSDADSDIVQAAQDFNSSDADTDVDLYDTFAAKGVDVNILSSDAATYTDADVTNGATYCYVATDVEDTAATSLVKALVTTTTVVHVSANETIDCSIPLAAPAVTATVGSRSVDLAWDRADGAYGYAVYVADAAVDGSCGDYAEVARVDAEVLTHRVDNLVNEDDYCFRVVPFAKDILRTDVTKDLQTTVAAQLASPQLALDGTLNTDFATNGTYTAVGSGSFSDSAIIPSAVAGKDTSVVANDNLVRAINWDGSEKWTYDAVTTNLRLVHDSDYARIVYTTRSDVAGSRICALRDSDGVLDPTFNGGSCITVTAADINNSIITSDRIYAVASHTDMNAYVYSIDRNTGTDVKTAVYDPSGTAAFSDGVLSGNKFVAIGSWSDDAGPIARAVVYNADTLVYESYFNINGLTSVNKAIERSDGLVAVLGADVGFGPAPDYMAVIAVVNVTAKTAVTSNVADIDPTASDMVLDKSDRAIVTGYASIPEMVAVKDYLRVWRLTPQSDLTYDTDAQAYESAVELTQGLAIDKTSLGTYRITGKRDTDGLILEVQ